MSREDLKKLSQRAVELWNSDSPDRPEDLVAGHYQNHQAPDIADGAVASGLLRWKEVLQSYHEDLLVRSSRIRETPQATREPGISTAGKTF